MTTTTTNVLYTGKELSRGEKLVSNNSLYSLVMQEDGNFVEYDQEGNVLWAADTTATWKKGYMARMQDDGVLVVMDESETVLWASSQTPYSTDTYRLLLGNDASAVVYDSTDAPIWNNQGSQKVRMPRPAAGSNALYTGQKLSRGQRLRSNNSLYSLVMQEDGNFVEYDNDGKVLWMADATATYKKGYSARMQDDGVLVVLDQSENVLWVSSYTTYPARTYRLLLENNANAVVFDGQDAPIWVNHASARTDTDANPRLRKKK